MFSVFCCDSGKQLSADVIWFQHNWRKLTASGFLRTEIHAIQVQQSHITRLYLACADVFPQAVLCDGDLQVRVVLPSVSVRGVFPATGPGRQLNTWQEEAKAHRNLQLLQGRVATSWGR